ncbi:MAG: hypothetical protein EOP04_30985, partial [Proteobacteria bacterium]
MIACNVIHATGKIDPTLDHVRSLLRPGGKFILMEITEDQLYYSLVFGVFAGWWAGYDEGRKLSPLLEVDDWSRRLTDHGFHDTDEYFKDYKCEDGGTLSVFIATAGGKSGLDENLSLEIVGHSDGSSDVRRVLQSLRTRLTSHAISCCGLSCSPTS